MRIRLLGPVEVEIAGTVIPIPRRRERCLLSVLMLELDRVIPMERLAELLWDGDPPPRARRILHGHVSRLRAALGSAGADGGITLDTIGDGYRAAADPHEVDVHQFRHLLDQADSSADLAERIALTRAALDLWRGPLLANAASDWLRTRLCSDLDEQRLVATEKLFAASLALRRETAVLPELARATAAHPGRESLVELYMRALYQAGRRTDALAAYDRARAYLVDELGLDPGARLRSLQREILRDQVAVPPPATGDRTAPTAPAVPRQLPAPPALFTGRAAELGALARGLDPAGAVVVAIDGMAGVGKTALALQWAHQVAERFPDGQMFLDLRGYTDQMTPIDPAEALERLLRAWGVPAGQIPERLDDRAGAWRSALAGRRVLLVLDNAATPAQVRPMLPGAPGCLVLLTSRHRLAALDPTVSVSLEALPLADAVSLFTRATGPDLPGGHDRATEIVELCGRLPLAIRVAAARLRSRPSWGPADLAGRLRQRRDRLALSELDDGTRSVNAALELSYQHLSTAEQRTYRLLGLYPGGTLDLYAAAALADLTVEPARRQLDQLLHIHVLQEPTPGRFTFHDLVRAHAAALATTETAPVRRAAMRRLLDYYRHTAAEAMDAAYPLWRPSGYQVPPARTPRPTLSSPAGAIAWLDTELPNLLAAAARANPAGLTGHVKHLSTIVAEHLHTRGRYDDLHALYHHGLVTARAGGDHAGEAAALNGLGWSDWVRGRHQASLDHFTNALTVARAGHRDQEAVALIGRGWSHLRSGQHRFAREEFQSALTISRQIAHPGYERQALLGIGWSHWHEGRYAPAAEAFSQALDACRAAGNRLGEMDALLALGNAHRVMGRHQQAVDDFEQALGYARDSGHRYGELHALLGLGKLCQLRGRLAPALDHFDRAGEIARATGQLEAEANALNATGHIHRRQGRYQAAREHHQHALELARAVDDRNWQLQALDGLGRLCLTGDPDAALAHGRQALTLAHELRQPADEARVHDSLAQAHHLRNEPDAARWHWQRALDTLTRLGTDTTDGETTIAGISDQLARVAGPPDPAPPCPSCPAAADQ